MFKKKILFVLMMLVLILPVSVFAESPIQTEENNQNVVEGYYFCEDDIVDPNIIVPLSTCTGNGGVARINALSYGLTWNVDPKFSPIYNFVGQITMTDAQTGSIVDIIPVTCSGAFGGMCGNEVDPDVPYKNRPYIATLTGRADDLSGLGYWLVPPCSIPYMES